MALPRIGPLQLFDWLSFRIGVDDLGRNFINPLPAPQPTKDRLRCNPSSLSVFDEIDGPVRPRAELYNELALKAEIKNWPFFHTFERVRGDFDKIIPGIVSPVQIIIIEIETLQVLERSPCINADPLPLDHIDRSIFGFDILLMEIGQIIDRRPFGEFAVHPVQNTPALAQRIR